MRILKSLIVITLLVNATSAFANTSPLSCREPEMTEAQARVIAAGNLAWDIQQGYHEVYSSGSSYACHNGFTFMMQSPIGHIDVIDAYQFDGDKLGAEIFTSCATMTSQKSKNLDIDSLRAICLKFQVQRKRETFKAYFVDRSVQPAIEWSQRLPGRYFNEGKWSEADNACGAMGSRVPTRAEYVSLVRNFDFFINTSYHRSVLSSKGLKQFNGAFGKDAEREANYWMKTPEPDTGFGYGSAFGIFNV
jgi:hypothetical protein